MKRKLHVDPKVKLDWENADNWKGRREPIARKRARARTMNIELPYVIEKTGVQNVMYYAHLIGLNFCGKPAPTKAEAVKNLKKVVLEMEKFWLDNYKKRDESGVSLPAK